MVKHYCYSTTLKLKFTKIINVLNNASPLKSQKAVGKVSGNLIDNFMVYNFIIFFFNVNM